MPKSQACLGRQAQKPKIATLGGGTRNSIVLSALKNCNYNLYYIFPRNI